RVAAVDGVFLYEITSRVDARPAIAHGTTALIWVAETYSSGAGMLSNVTCTSENVVGRNPPAATVETPAAGPRLLPYSEIISPADTGPGTLLPALATMFASGVGSAVIRYVTSTVCVLVIAVGDENVTTAL